MPQVLRNSTIPLHVIQAAVQANPIRVTPEGNLSTGPVRLGYQAVYRPSKPQKGDDGQMRDGRFEIEMLFPLTLQEMGVMYNVWLEHIKQAHPTMMNPNPQLPGSFYGLEFPFNDQGRKQNKPGYTPGLIQVKATSQNQPTVIDVQGRTITDEKAIYSGVWVIAILNTWKYSTIKKGVSFGIQTIVKLADDEHTYQQGSVDAAKVVAGINVNSGFTSALAQPAQIGGVMPNSYGQPAPAAPPGAYPAPGGFAPPPGTAGVDY